MQQAHDVTANRTDLIQAAYQGACHLVGLDRWILADTHHRAMMADAADGVMMSLATLAHFYAHNRAPAEAGYIYLQQKGMLRRAPVWSAVSPRIRIAFRAFHAAYTAYLQIVRDEQALAEANYETQMLRDAPPAVAPVLSDDAFSVPSGAKELPDRPKQAVKIPAQPFVKKASSVSK